MLASKRQALGNKCGNSRFSLLLLEDGEFFLDDLSVFKYPDPVFQCLTFDSCIQRKVQGRLKLCTRSIMFEPQDIMQPILKFPFRDMNVTPCAEVFDDETNEMYLSFECNSVIEMKERNVDHPYTHRVLTDSSMYSTKVIFSLVHSKLPDFLEAIAPLWSLSHKKNVLNKIDEERFLAPVLEPRHTDVFDASLLADFRERPLLSKCKLVDRIVPLLKFPGAMMLTNQRVYFQPAQINNIGDPVLMYEYTKVVGLHKRRHMLKQCGLEVLLEDRQSYFYSFRTMKDRDEIYAMMVKQPGLNEKLKQNCTREMLLKWQHRQVSNFEYLSFLNDEAGRTTNDLTQYPVFPWVIADYKSDKLDLTNSQTFRDLSKPVGALNADRLAYFQQRFQNMPSGMEAEGLPPPFLYGTHYSTPGYVLFYLVRMAPEYMLCLQNGKFDAPDRLFRSIAGTYQSCLTNHADLKELIPAFYDTENPPLIEWLQNTRNLDLGTTQNLSRVGDVELPPWADNAHDFVEKNRQALECDFVSEHLHEWIDLIFGYKQQGAEAVAANNLFYYLSYEGAVNLETITDPVERCSFEAQIQEFGQTPKLLFKSPHPSRSQLGMDVTLAPLDVVPPLPVVPPPPAVSPVRAPVPVAHATPAVDDPEPAPSFRTSSWGFKRPTLSKFTGLTKNVTGLTASLRRRMERTSWGWSFDATTTSMWDESLPHFLHSQAITCVNVSKDIKTVFSTSHDGTFKVSSSEDGVVRRSYTCGGPVLCMDISPDEKYAFFGTADLDVHMFALETGRVGKLSPAHAAAVTGVCVVDDAKFVTCSLDGTMKIWQYGPIGMLSTPTFVYEGCDSALTCLDVNSDGTIALVGTEEGSVCVFDLRSNELISQIRASDIKIQTVRFGMTGATFTCMTSTNVVAMFALNGASVCTLQAPLKDVHGCMVSDGEYALTGSDDGGVYIWQLNEGDSNVLKACTVSIPHSNKSAVTAVNVSGNGQSIVAGTGDGSVRVWAMRKKSARSRLGF
ncbi:hypothetical protein H310_00940 [Aphanomyces invadans]|uniref:BEACH domain-containing protein n=1 Tax=Aphanomyces invadans TaxID=157072 RepID=A0A024UQ50_9STRA|nr:hypothetical protein H310_00940 [Aphanomyces invadans]ETW08330.1 hypothetical protein H310_00940 [Aphanomyces invadans]|eukprot:XP_008862135.1 hypothetical protein H310_00940 [Aphanomyces invadans]